ncbi:MAG TPA: PorV/PorQ family protein [Gemmatimonadaceae bacterium]|nr:PorV/PorQ family protein [Gemmatimonadaceae bacterium]
MNLPHRARSAVRSRSARLVAVALFALAAGVIPSAALRAQTSTGGATFLLIPVGARAIGMGQAVVAEQGGTEAIWWNPAGVAQSTSAEVAIHHYQSFVGTGDALAVLFPSRRLGTLAISVYLLDYGEQAVLDPENVPIGQLLLRNVAYGATYGVRLGSRLSAGATFKVIQFRADCSGSCADVPNTSSTGTAVDLGAQYDGGPTSPITIGLAVRHLGPKYQINDAAQADPLPTRVELGVGYRVAQLERIAPETMLRVSGDLVDNLDFDETEGHVGAELGWRERAFLRGGYVFNSSEIAGPSLGVGLATGGLRIDIARIFEGFSSGAGQTPTYVSLRYLF